MQITIIGKHVAVYVGIIIGLAACRPSDILDVPPPSGEFASGAVQGSQTADPIFYGARSQLAAALDQSYGIIQYSGLLSDEFEYTELGYINLADIDARFTRAAASYGKSEPGDTPLASLLAARSSLLLAVGELEQHDAAAQVKIGEAFALVGYAELFLAETYCAGVTLSTVVQNGGWSYGTPLTTDSLLGTAAIHFDSALMHATGSDTIRALASVGLGRALVDRGQLAAADTVVRNVSTSFVYSTQLEPSEADNTGSDNFYEDALGNGYGWSNVSDKEGGNGLDFVSAGDPRLVLDSTLIETVDGVNQAPDSVFYYPVKFGNPSSGLMPLATGLEARLIEAEAALPANGGGSAAAWLADLNALRNTMCTGSANSTCTYGTGQVPGQPYGLVSLTDPGTDTGEVSLTFRERAFWLFGTGTRLGDLRRLIRQYHRGNETVFPTGPYATGLRAGLQNFYTTYGPDVNFTLPTPAAGVTITPNPHYEGCISSTTTA